MMTERDEAKREKPSHLDRANRIARRLVKVCPSYGGPGRWAVAIDGWRIYGYDHFKTKAEANIGRKIVVQHFDDALYRAGVK